MSSAIRKDGGYPVEIFIDSKGLQNFECGICLGVLKDAQSCCTNSHSFCKACLNKVTAMKYPNCAQSFSDADIRSQHLVNNFLSGLSVKCCASISNDEHISKKTRSSRRDLCDWTGQLSELKNHTYECGYLVIGCVNDGCPVQLSRREMETHLSSCGFEVVKCADCSKLLLSKECDDHWDNDCMYKVIPCPLGCAYRTLRKDMKKHATHSLHILMMMQEIQRLHTLVKSLSDKLVKLEQSVVVD